MSTPSKEERETIRKWFSGDYPRPVWCSVTAEKTILGLLDALEAAEADRDDCLRKYISCDDKPCGLPVRRASELDELQATFDLRWKADMRAIKEWQAKTGKELVWPDHADLCVTLLAERDRLREALRPWAECVDALDEAGVPDVVLLAYLPGLGIGLPNLTAGACRRARAALDASEKGEKL